MEACSAANNFFTLDPIAVVASYLQHSALHSVQPSEPLFEDTLHTRASRKDKYLFALWPIRFQPLQKVLTGAHTRPCFALPPFPYHSMSVKGRHNFSGVPATPRVISPSPTPSDGPDTAASSKDALYFGPVTRSVARRRRDTPQPAPNSINEESDWELDLRRARTRSRSPIDTHKVKALSPSVASPKTTKRSNKEKKIALNGNLSDVVSKGHLAPPPSKPLQIESTARFWSWRDLSRSPSPLGLIPIHRHWRTFVHKHEVPRKLLHVSIGFLTLWLYTTGTQTRQVCPYLMAALVPITLVDYLRHKSTTFNRIYVKVLGALMRESEYSGWNGVIFYLLGAWIVLYFFPKDVGMMGILLLSWCDTAASTFGRLYGRYTPQLRSGKSLAGSLAAFVVGVATAGWFWGIFAPNHGPYPGDELYPFMFTGTLGLPTVVASALGMNEPQASISGTLALGIVSIISGFVAASSEVVDLFGWDDNLTIPVLSGIGIWGFLKLFG